MVCISVGSLILKVVHQRKEEKRTIATTKEIPANNLCETSLSFTCNNNKQMHIYLLFQVGMK